MAHDESTIRLICFDVGRVLLRICDGWVHACELAAIHPPDDVDQTTIHKLSKLSRLHETGQLTGEKFARQCAALTGISVEDANAMLHAWLIDPFPGALELVDEVRATGVRTACLSNTNDAHWALMNDADAPTFLDLSRFDYAFASHLIGAMKPDPTVYEHVESQTRTAPEAIVFFDDGPDNIAGALERGWQAHAIDTSRDPVPQMREVLLRLGVLSS